jgi:hypothetical protein
MIKVFISTATIKNNYIIDRQLQVNFDKTCSSLLKQILAVLDLATGKY